MKMIKNKLQLFSTPVLIENYPNLVEDLIKTTDSHITNAIQRDSKEILLRNEKIENLNDDRNWVYHSKYNLYNEPDFLEFHNFIGKKSRYFLEEMGYDLSEYSLVYNESWVQEFSKNGGSNHQFHIHSDTHVSGFFFLKCSKNTSFPVFMDPRTAHVMMKLPEKNKEIITDSSEYVNFRPNVGDLIMFPSYLSHSFSVDYGLEPFRLIHFTIKAINNRYL